MKKLILLLAFVGINANAGIMDSIKGTFSKYSCPKGYGVCKDGTKPVVHTERKDGKCVAVAGEEEKAKQACKDAGSELTDINVDKAFSKAGLSRSAELGKKAAVTAKDKVVEYGKKAKDKVVEYGKKAGTKAKEMYDKVKKELQPKGRIREYVTTCDGYIKKSYICIKITKLSVEQETISLFFYMALQNYFKIRKNNFYSDNLLS